MVEIRSSRVGLRVWRSSPHEHGKVGRLRLIMARASARLPSRTGEVSSVGPFRLSSTFLPATAAPCCCLSKNIRGLPFGLPDGQPIQRQATDKSSKPSIPSNQLMQRCEFHHPLPPFPGRLSRRLFFSIEAEVTWGAVLCCVVSCAQQTSTTSLARIRVATDTCAEWRPWTLGDLDVPFGMLTIPP
jgi:hypothetical protein